MSHTTRVNEKKTSKGIGSAISHTIQNKLSFKHFDAGDVSKKYPIKLSDGKTVVFAKTKEDVERVTKFWEDKIKHINYSL